MKDRELYCADVEWLLTERDADCGVQSSFGAMIAELAAAPDPTPRRKDLPEPTAKPTGRSGVGSSLSPDPYHSGQCELAAAPRGRGHQTAFARDRRLLRVWLSLDAATRRVLAAHYLGMSPELEKNQRQALHAELADFASAASWLIPEHGNLRDDGVPSRADVFAALLDRGAQGRAVILAVVRAWCDVVVRRAHRAWYVAAGEPLPPSASAAA